MERRGSDKQSSPLEPRMVTAARATRVVAASTDSVFHLVYIATCHVNFLRRQFRADAWIVAVLSRSENGQKTDRWQQVLSTIRGTNTAQQVRDLRLMSVDSASSKSPGRRKGHKEQVSRQTWIAVAKTRV
jgi:hypothetical protein